MWLALSFASALMLGFYDVAKKASLRDNPVLTVLFLNTLFSTVRQACQDLLLRGIVAKLAQIID